ncbi:MAG: hypothetical protein IKK33_06295 [Lachnospiraceae bacterium]|nr:hypothetical protein [Lachnospiraceae bacterium]
MHLFSIRQSENVKNPIKIVDFDSRLYHYNMAKDEVSALPKLAVGYYNDFENVEFPAIIHEPVFMVDNELKKLLKLYEREMIFRGLHVYDDKRDEQNVKMHSYWAPGVEAYTCGHPDMKVLPNGSVEKLILHQDKIPQRDVFKVGDIREERVIVTEAVVESILRRHMYGICIEEVEIGR